MCSLTVLARHSAFSSGYLPTTPTILAGLLHAYKRGIAEPPALEQVLTYAETAEPELRARAKTVLGASLRDRFSCEVGPLALQSGCVGDVSASQARWA